MALRTNLNELRFFTSTLLPRPASFEVHRDVGVAAQRTFLHVAVAYPEVAHHPAQLLKKHLRLFPDLQVRLGDDLQERRARPVEVEQRDVTRVDHLSRVLLEVDLADADALLPLAQLDLHRIRRCPGGSGTARSGSSWEGRDRSSSCARTGWRGRACSSAPAPRGTPCGWHSRSAQEAPRGSPGRRGRHCVFGSSPKAALHPQKTLVRVRSCVWTSRPRNDAYTPTSSPPGIRARRERGTPSRSGGRRRTGAPRQRRARGTACRWGARFRRPRGMKARGGLRGLPRR